MSGGIAEALAETKIGEKEMDPDEMFEEMPASGSEIKQNGNVKAKTEEEDEVDGGRIETDEEEKEDEDEDEGEGEGDQEHEFYEGKFVWAKVRNNPWWPGQIYDPSDASDLAKKLQKRKKLLVAYFGDGSFSWSSPSQLKPFADNFDKLSKQSTSTKFTYAVQNALDEIGRLVEFQTTCSCVSKEYQIGLARPEAVNAGIKEGVPVPDYDLSELSVPHHEPAKIISLLENIAVKGSFTRMLELTVLKSWLSAFYRANGCKELASFNQPQLIEGLEDKSKNGLVNVNDPVLDLEKGPSDDWTSTPGFGKFNEPFLQKCEGIAADKLYRRRKRKSLAKLMKEDKVVESNDEEENVVEDETSFGKRKIRKTRPDEEEEGGPKKSKSDFISSLVKKKGRRKSGTLKSLEEVLSAENGGDEDKKQANRKDQASIVKKEDKDELLSMYGKKKRKKGLASLECSGNEVINVVSKVQMTSPKNKKESVTGKVDKISKKGKSRRLDEDSEGKSNENARDHGHENHTSPLQKKTRKTKKTKTLGTPEISEKIEMNTKNGSKKRVSGNVNDDQGETKNVPASREKKKSRQMKKAEQVATPEISHGKEANAKNGSKSKVSATENDDKKIIENVRTSRKRKESVYLSPPFTNLHIVTRNLSPRAARLGERMTKVAGQVIGSSPMLKSSNEPLKNKLAKDVETSKDASLKPNSIPLQENGSSAVLKCSDEPLQDNLSKEIDTASDSSLNPYPPPSKEEQENIINSVQINISMTEFVSEVRSAAINPLFLREKDVINMMERFNLAYRNAIYLDGSYYKTYHKAQQGEKQVSLKPGFEIVEEDSNQILDSISQPKVKQFGEGSDSKTNDNGTEKEASKPSSLWVIFPPGFNLPTKNDLVATFSEFGLVNVLETDVSHDSYCGKVVFSGSDDTEKAFRMCLEKNPYGLAKVSFRLRYSEGSSKKADDITRKLDGLLGCAVDEGSQLLFVKQKLEIMTSMVDNCNGKLSNELISKLENEVKELQYNMKTFSKTKLC